MKRRDFIRAGLLASTLSGGAAHGNMTLLGAGKKPAGGGAQTIAYVDAGTGSEGGTSVTPAYPTTAAGNMLILVVWSRANTDPTPDTPADWTQFGTYNGGAGAFGLDSGNARVTAYWKEATGSETGTITVNLANTSGNTMWARIHRFSKSGGTWATPVIDGGADSTGGTAWSVTGGAAFALAVEDLIFAVSCANGDTVASVASHALSATSITFGTVTERDDRASGFGNDHQAFSATVNVTAGSATSAITYTATGASSGTDTPAGASAFVRLRAS